MAEAEIAPEISPVAAEESTAPEASPPAEETAPVEEEANPKDGEEEPAAEGPGEADGAASNDHKRKLEDLEQADEGEEEKKPEGEAPEAADEGRSDGGEAGAGDAKRPRLDGEADGLGADGGHEVQNLEASLVVNGQHPSVENAQATPIELQKSAAEVSEHDGVTPAGQQLTTGPVSSSRKIEVPNNKVGVLIGKAGDTIKYLQYNSGAKIQITRDAEADPHSSSRPVELIGSLESINKAEQLIRDVIAEADAGGSPALVARGFGTVQSGAEQTEIQVPNEKVGLVIGKGGETIKNLQTRSGARIQLIPQHLPEGDSSKERTVRISGNKKQIEAAKEMIKSVISQAPLRSAPQAAGYNQQAYPPRGPATLAQWGPRPQPPSHLAPGYDYQQRGTYPTQTTQYPSQPYGSYPQQAPSRSSLGASWDQRPSGPIQTPQTGGYDYYKQGGQALDTQLSNHAPAPSPAPAPASGPVNYNYGQSQAGYGQPAPYAQSIPPQQNYGHGYNEPKYDAQVPSQQMYGQPVSSQPGVYAQQTPQSGYPQQQEAYSKPAYGGVPQSYGPPRASQPGDAMYQGSVPSSYGSGAPTQQSYPYASGAPAQSAPAYGQTYGPTSGSVDGYAQPSPAGYTQPGGQVPSGYGQGAQPVPAYTQQGQQSGGYGQYPSSQPSYGDQSAPSNVNYGYQGGSADGAYGNNLQNSGYTAAPVSSQPGYGQAGYVQQPSNLAAYDQSQPGYGGPAGTAPAGYTKGVSPQPGYGGQYDAVQMYGHH